MHQKHIPEDWMITQKEAELIFPVADGSAKISVRDYEFQEPTLRRESTVRRENLSGECHGDGEEFRPEEAKRWRRNREGFWGQRRSSERISFIVITLNLEVQLSCREKNHPLFPRFILLNETPPRRNIRCGRRIGEAKTSEAKQIQLYLVLQGKDGILYLISTLRKNSFRWKDPEEALHVIFSEGESKHMLSRLAAQRVCETKFFVNQQTRWTRKIQRKAWMSL